MGLYLRFLDLSVVEEFVLQQNSSLQEEIRIAIWCVYKTKEFKINGRIDAESEKFFKKMEPKSSIGKCAYLFSFYSFNFDLDENNLQEEAVDKKKRDVIRNLLKEYGISGLKQLIDIVDNPGLIAQIAREDSFKSYHNEICNLISECSNDKIKNFFQEYVKEYPVSHWLKYLEVHQDQWSCSQVTHFLTLHALSKEVYEIVEKRGLVKEYWKLLDKGSILRARAKIISILPQSFLILLEHGRSEEAAFCMSYSLEKNHVTPNECIEFLQKLPKESLNDIRSEVLNFLQNEELDEKQTNDLINLEQLYMRDFSHSDSFRPKAINKKASEDPEFFFQQVISKDIPFSSYWDIVPIDAEFMEKLKIQYSSNQDDFASAQCVLAHGAAKYIDFDPSKIPQLPKNFQNSLEEYSYLRKCFFQFLNREKIKILPLEQVDKIIENYVSINKPELAQEIRTAYS